MEGSKGIALFSYRGIEVRLDYSWFIIFALVTVTLGAYYFPSQYPDLSPVEVWSISLVASILLFVSVLLHEFAHSIVAQNLGIEITSIVLFIFGGVAQMQSEPEDPQSELYIASAGPLCSLALGLLFLGTYYGLEPLLGDAFGAVIWYIGYINLALVAFNILPGFPLDGGRMARALIWSYTKNLRKATRIVSNIGQAFAAFLIALGVLDLLLGAVIQGLFGIFMGMFLQQAASSSYQMVALREGLANIPVKRIMTADPFTVPPDINLQQLIDDYFYRYKVHSFPVVRAETTIGLVSIQQVKGVPREKWGDMLVSELMTPLNKIQTLKPNDDAFEVLQRMLSNNIGRLPVMEGDKVLGIVSRKDIMEFVSLHEEIEN